MTSGPCETAGEDADAGDHEPGLSACDGRLEVLGEATVAPEPGKGAFDHPAFGLGLEGPDTLGSGDDLDGPLAELGDRAEQFAAAIDPIGEDVPKLGKREAEGFQQRHRTMIVLD